MGLGLDLMRSLIILAALSLTLWGCNKKEETKNWGPEIPIEEVRKTQTEALSILDPQKIKQGEFAYFIKTQELFSSQTPSSLLIEEEAITVTERLDFSDYFSITTIRESIDHLENNSPHNKFKDVYQIAKDAPKQKLSQLNDDISPIEEPKISFHNLRVEKVRLPRPSKVIEREPCPAGKNCDIDATRILYDVVITETGKDPQSNQAELIISAQVPFFAGVLRSCITTVAAIDEVRPFVRQCKALYDYQWAPKP